MFYDMIKRKRDGWLSRPDCPVRATIRTMEDAAKCGGGLRNVQIDAIKTYLFLKIVREGGRRRPDALNWLCISVCRHALPGTMATPSLGSGTSSVSSNVFAVNAVFQPLKNSDFSFARRSFILTWRPE